MDGQYRFKRAITNHAIEQLRIRCPASFDDLSDDALRVLLDKTIDDALARDDFWSGRDVHDEPARFVSLANTLSHPVVALAKPDLRGGQTEAIVTILTQEMADGLRRAEISAPVPVPEIVLTYGDQFEIVPAPQAAARVQELVATGSMPRVWREAAVKISVSVEIP